MSAKLPLRLRFYRSTAVGTEAVCCAEAGFEVGTSRMETVAAGGAVVHMQIGFRSAPWAVAADRISKQEIQNKADRVGNKDGDDCPQRPVHATASGIGIDVTDK